MKMNDIMDNISKTLGDPLKYVVAPTIYFIYSSTLILYGYLFHPWVVSVTNIMKIRERE